jgi:outer membrane receptor for ferrienterochelin and colicins
MRWATCSGKRTGHREAWAVRSVVLGMVLAPAVGWAQEAEAMPAAANGTDVAAEAAPGDLADLERLLQTDITVASRTPEKLLQAPSSVTVFTQEEIRDLGVSSLEELLNFVPGFQATRDVEQGTGYRLGARGRSKYASEYVLLLVDGQRVNDLYTGGATLLDRLIAVENIQRVEVIRGPGSALYGSNAFLGVVSIVTRQGERSAQVRGGTLGSMEGAVNASASVGEVAVDSFVKAFSDEGYRYRNVTDQFGHSGDVVDPQRGFDVSGHLRWRGLTLSVRHTERVQEDFLTFGVLQRDSSEELTRRTMVSARYELQPLERLAVTLSARYGRDRWDTQAELIPAGTQLAPDVTLQQAFSGGPLLTAFSAALGADLSYQLAPSNLLQGGASYERAGILEVANVMTHHPVTLEYQGAFQRYDGALSFNETATRQVLGVYLQDRQEVADFLQLTAGVRFDVYDDFGSSLNPRLAAIFNLPFNGYVKALYGKAFRAPSYLEFYDKNNPVSFGNRNLRAEDIQTLELAYTQVLSNLSATVTVFRNVLANQIDFGAPIDDPNNPYGAPGFSNRTDVQQTHGLEAELLLVPVEGMVVRGTFSQLFEADALLVSPRTASLIASYRLGALTLNANGIYRERMASLPEQGSYVVLNAAATWALTEQLRLQGTVKNLSNTAYSSYSAALPGGVPNRGRTFQVGLLYDF